MLGNGLALILNKVNIWNHALLQFRLINNILIQKKYKDYLLKKNVSVFTFQFDNKVVSTKVNFLINF